LSKSYDIAVLAGDGIGVDVTEAALRVLRAVEAGLSEVSFVCEEYAVGAGEYLRNGETPLPEAAFAGCEKADAVLLGAMGLPHVRWPDGKEITPQIDLRERFDLYAGMRPIYLFSGEDSPLKNYEAGQIDFLLVRESTEGLFSARLAARSEDGNEARDVMRITRKGSERVIRAAFVESLKRRKKVTLVDKANVLPSIVFFREIFDEVARDFPEVETERVYVDAAALFLVRRPESFDVLVTENTFGDILSDLAAGIVGGMGMAPSGDIGESCGVRCMVHENWRWQPWYREIKGLLDGGAIGEVFHCAVQCRLGDGWGDGWGEDTYLARQPFFREYERLFLFETGVHFLDTFRFLFGEVASVFATTARRNPVIKGEDSALVVCRCVNGVTALLDANRYNESVAENPRYTFGTLRIDGSAGHLEMDFDGRIYIKPLGEERREHGYSLSKEGFAGDCVYAVQRHFVDVMLNGGEFESTVTDYMKSVRLVEDAYECAG
jgi:3-isopropylmalate dehydrogenase